MQTTRKMADSTADITSVIAGRRAIRSYTDEIVDRTVIEDLLRAAVEAPSAMNLQPWAFAVFQGRALLETFSRRAAAFFREPHTTLVPEARAHAGGDDALFHRASTLILICATSDDRQAAEDCCLAAENLMLSAHARGLGTCPIGSSRAWLTLPSVREELGLSHAIPVFPLVLGVPAAVPPGPTRKEPIILAWRDTGAPCPAVPPRPLAQSARR